MTSRNASEHYTIYLVPLRAEGRVWLFVLFVFFSVSFLLRGDREVCCTHLEPVSGLFM